MTKKVSRRFKQSFGPFNMLTVHKCSDTRPFRHLSNPAFFSLKFQKEIISEAHVFFLKYFEFYVDSGNTAKNTQNTFFHFEIIGFELVALDSRFH